MSKRELRELDDLEYARATRIYGLMAVALAKAQRLILIRNKFVDANILDLLEMVGRERPALPAELLLVDAWTLWCQKRDMRSATWPVTIFKSELQAALALVDLQLNDSNGGAA